MPEIVGNRDAAMAEIVHALDVLKADGVTLFSRYGDDKYYIGHSYFAPLWEELDRRGCIIFLHPTGAAVSNGHLPEPLMDYPHETARAATDLIINGVIQKHKNVKIILSHAGGTLPYLAGRIASSLADLRNLWNFL